MSDLGATEAAASAAEPPPDAVGRLVGRIVAGYRIEAVIGVGAMGTVYRATQLSMRRPVALKVLAERYARDPRFAARFRREAQAAGRLHHPNLVLVHDSGEADGLLYLSMELIAGRALSALLAERGRLSLSEVASIARQALEGLAYAHEQGVIHRDIKPGNLLLAADGRLKITDLGLSRLVDDDPDPFLTRPGSFLGTPHYVAPEQARDARCADARSDLYALGATLYHLACGRPPFSGETAMAVLLAAQTQPLSWPEDGPPAPWRSWLSRLLARDPAQRPADARAALAELERVMTGTVRAAPPAPRRWLAALVAAAVLGGAALIVVAVLRAREQALRREGLAQVIAARRLFEEHRYPAALDELRRIAERFPDPEVRAACEAATAHGTAAWDAWALPRVQDLERAVQAQLAAGRYAEARDALRAVPETWHSPAAEPRLDALQEAWETAVTREAERRPESPAPELLREWRARAFAVWRRLAADPPSALQATGEGLRFLASGQAPLPTLPLRPRQSAIRLRWQGGGSGFWRLASAQQTAFELTAAGARLGEQRLQPDADGSVLLHLAPHRDGLRLGGRGAGGPLTVYLSGPAQLSWQLIDAQVLLLPGPAPRGER